MPAPAPQPITLNFHDVVRIAGEILEGTVDLNVAAAQDDHIEQLRIKFRGAIATKITVNHGQNNSVHRETVPLVHSDLTLWTQGAAFPKAGSHVLSCPFRFQLPDNLPPSFHGSLPSRSGIISYSLEVVGDRPGLFRSNRRIRRIISVLPAASQTQLVVTEALRQGWMGQWKTFTQSEQLRTGLWGDYSHAHAILSLPDLPAFPVATPIPFSLHITTETKPVKRSDRPEEKPGKPLFPAPPTASSQLKLGLRRETTVRVRQRTRELEDTFDLQAIRDIRDTTEKRPASASASVSVPAMVDEPEWVPQDSKDRGVWKRAVHFNSTLTFPYAPTFSTQTLAWHYTVHVVVPFPGIGNGLKLQFPITLAPGWPCPPPPIGVPGSSRARAGYADVIPAGPPPMLDLPPAYWAGDEHDWDDEKTGSEKQ
ncbi:hypothetical protein B0H15DRAFT_547524 [Mycena belliarum]|uniref:Arrestin-like N-terminal domain-containing protein n=1 Tax=Mycena belliarum TaxID=1033014 RepID=A0AAD6XVR5_9AGAR|nr:hypothetical protein B0H15DRAFT_547524 [Mycena belliae]